MSKTLRLKYVYFGGRLNKRSVQHKIFCQIRGLRKSGIDAEGLYFNTLEGEEANGEFAPHIQKIGLPVYAKQYRYFQQHYVRQSHFRFVAQYLKEHSDEYDLVFLRHAGSGPGYEEIIKEIASKVILYIPSNRIREAYCERKYAKEAGIGNAAFGWWGYFRFWLREKRFYRKHLHTLKAVVTFTPEFGQIIQKQSPKKLELIYNRDGADTTTVAARKPRASEAKVKLIFLKGSGQKQKWAGLDRLIESIEAYPDLPIELYITGNAINQAHHYQRPFVTLTGRLSHDELEKLIDTVDLGVSNLSNHLIHFNETTNLKSRDYYSRGLPFIQSNTMPDIEGTSAAKYYLNLPNDESIIDMQKVYDFALAMRADTEHPQTMHRFAQEHLDWDITASELADRILQL